jgi:uncharacterized RDD family membrane protein YckC
VRRVLAFGIDWVVIATYGALLAGITMWCTSGEPRAFANPLAGQTFAFVVFVVPIIFYFALLEHSRWHASVGKRLVGLVVRRETGGQLTIGRVLLRNGIKLMPWECGHTVAHQAIAANEIPVWTWPFVVISMAVPLWWLFDLFRTGATPYDRWLDIRVTTISRANFRID